VRVRKADVAETLLSLVGSAERARSFVGDLIEERDRGRVWFWRSVTRLWLAMLGRDLMAAPFTMAISCAAAWFVYMLGSVAFGLALYLLVTLAWGTAHVLANHTGVELLTEALKIRFDWPPIPDSATYAVQAAVLFAITPFYIGWGSSRFWRGHEVSLALMMLIVWTAMSMLVPVVGIGIRVHPAMVPVLASFVLAGALLERFRLPAPS